jgi:ethanolamine permease
MAERRSTVTYREADSDYFAKRTLRRHAGVWSLWALGVAAVISGDFFGWNFGLEFGFGGLLVATLVITVMYLGLCYSIAEMSPALPHTGGAYSFGRTAMGPWGGFVTGVAESIEYIVTPAVIVEPLLPLLDASRWIPRRVGAPRRAHRPPQVRPLLRGWPRPAGHRR